MSGSTPTITRNIAKGAETGELNTPEVPWPVTKAAGLRPEQIQDLTVPLKVLPWEVIMIPDAYKRGKTSGNFREGSDTAGKSSTFCPWENSDLPLPVPLAAASPFQRGRGQEDFHGYDELDDDFDDEFDDDFDMEFDDDGFEDRFEDEEEEELTEEETPQEDLDTDVAEEDEEFDELPHEDLEEDPPLDEELD
jgi:hypothetical protein